MKIEIKRLLYAASIPLSIYLAGAFVNADLNISHWSSGDRIFAVVFSALCLLFYWIITGIHIDFDGDF